MSIISPFLENSFISVLSAGSGLTNLTDHALNNWIQPLFLVAVAVFAIIFIKDRAWMKLIGFLGIAAIVGVVVFLGENIFGADGQFTKVGEGAANLIQTANAYGSVNAIATSIPIIE